MAEEVQVQESGGGLKIRIALGAIAAAALALFIFQNTDDAQVSFLWMDGRIPLSLLLVVTVALTVVLGMALTWILRRRD
jgi:uncharacterized integral membrane protein